MVVVTVDPQPARSCSPPEIVTRGWVHAPEAEALLGEASDVVRAALEKALAEGRHDHETLQPPRPQGPGQVRRRAHPAPPHDRPRRRHRLTRPRRPRGSPWSEPDDRSSDGRGVAVSVGAIVVTTKRRPAGARPSSRSAPGRRRSKSKGRARATRASKRRRRRPGAAGRRAGPGVAAWITSALSVLEGHVEDVWGIGLVTVGILGALGALRQRPGPGRATGCATASGMVLGVGRFLVPPAFAAAGVMLIAGRPRHEPARAGVGLALVAGLGGGTGRPRRRRPPPVRVVDPPLGCRGLSSGRPSATPCARASGTGAHRSCSSPSSTLALVLFTGRDPARPRWRRRRRVGAASCGTAAVPHGDDDELEVDGGVRRPSPSRADAIGRRRRHRRGPRPRCCSTSTRLLGARSQPPTHRPRPRRPSPRPIRRAGHLVDTRLDAHAGGAASSAAPDGSLVDGRGRQRPETGGSRP